MDSRSDRQVPQIPLGVGYYSVAEVARLLRLAPRTIRRWLGGYSYRDPANGRRFDVPPLWVPQFAQDDSSFELSFRDMIELRFVAAFIEAGLGLLAIRHCIVHARDCVQDERPFSTQRFQTDGKTIFLESLRQSGETELLDLKKGQYVIRDVLLRTFKDLDIEVDAVARWRPFNGKRSIVIDPSRAFGQPVATDYGVTTVALADAVTAEGSVARVAALYEVPASVVNDAVVFEASLETPLAAP